MPSDKEIETAIEKLLEKVIWSPRREEEHQLRLTDGFLRREIPTFIRTQIRLRALWRLQDPAIQREYFGRELDDEEKAALDNRTKIQQEAVEAMWTDIGTYYGVNKALKEYGWDLHYAVKRTLCIVCGTPKAEMDICPKCKIVTSVFTR